MGYHFGYNCKHYLPTLNKCRILIDKYISRKDLLDMMKKGLSTQDLFVYLNLSNKELINQIKTGKIIVNRQKNGKILFRVLSAWQWDNCPLANDGGQCLYFEVHNGKTISCLMELKGIEDKHPNFKNVPSEENIKYFESEVIKTIEANPDGLFK